MSIYQFFDKNGGLKNNDSDNKINHQKQKNTTEMSKQDAHKLFVNKLNKFVNNEIIDMNQYTFIINFIKSRGSITSAEKYFTILQNINKDKLSIDDKKELDLINRVLFKHLYDLLDEEFNIQSDKFINNIENYNNKNEEFHFTDDQKKAIDQVCKFLYDDNMRTFGLYGYAGTGKTTTITKLIHYLLYTGYISSVMFTAPTNKAVNVIKSKFRNDLDDLAKAKLKIDINNEEVFDDIIYKLEEKGFNINFLTIHKSLNYKNDFDIEGERIFIKGDKSNLNNFDLIIVDECSMISFQIITHLFEEANKKDPLSKNNIKIIFLGDPAQLPPVNEKISTIFSKKDSDFDFNLYKNIFMNNSTKTTITDLDNSLEKFIENKFNTLKQYILQMKYVVLRQVMRSTDNDVIGICNEMRSYVLNEINCPLFYKYKSKKVFLYKYDKSKYKTDTLWFKKCVKYFKSKNQPDKASNIILTWTNKQTDIYNETIRKILYNKQTLDKYEIGDTLILTDFYNIKETDTQNDINYKKNKGEGNQIYSSEQIKITDIEKVIRGVQPFTEKLNKRINGIKNTSDIEEKYVKSVKLINKNTKRQYNCWKLHVQKLSEIINGTIPKTYQLYVIDDEFEDVIKKDKQYCAEEIKKLRNYYRTVYKENINSIDKNVIRPLWKEMNNKLVDPFAKVNSGVSISCHRSQGSNFHNVFVDADDILNNPDREEAKRCLYTAMTRVSNELHILI